MKKFPFTLEPDRRALPELPQGPHEMLVPYSELRAVAKISNRQSKKRALAYFFAMMPLIFLVAYAPVIHTALIWLWLPLMFFAYSNIFRQLISPTHLQVGAEGVRFHSLNAGFDVVSTPWLPWFSVESISVRKGRLFEGAAFFMPANSESPIIELQLSRFNTPKMWFWWSYLQALSMPLGLFRRPAKLSICMRAVINEEFDGPELLAALKYFAEEKCTDNVLEMMQTSTPSFTRLWLEDFSNASQYGLGELQPGTELLGGEYTIVRRLATGGQSVVYEAKRQIDGTSETVALKEFALPIRGGRQVIDKALENVQNEAALLNSLSHDQIVRFVDTFCAGNRAYLATAFVSGRTLRDVVRESGAMDEQTAVSIGLQLCEILAYLHAQSPPVIHRDFSPDNLILRDDGSVVLVDFNVAQRLESERAHTVVGKQSYMAPEQFRGQPTQQSDIYSLGCILYWLLTGHDPKPISMSDPRALNSGIDPRLADIISGATAINLDARYKFAGEIERDLSELSDDAKLEPESELEHSEIAVS